MEHPRGCFRGHYAFDLKDLSRVNEIKEGNVAFVNGITKFEADNIGHFVCSDFQLGCV